MSAPDHYPINAEELARKLRVNAKSLRALIRLHDLVPGHVKHKEYRIYQEAETAVGRHLDVHGYRGIRPPDHPRTAFNRRSERRHR